MIKTQNLIPEVYYNKSRDFQFIGRIYDIIFNYIKTNGTTIASNPLSENMDKRFLDLLALTLGFKTKHNYNINQLYSICNCLATALKNKGSIYSIELSINALLQSQGINEKIAIIYDKNTFNLNIYLPSTLTNINLLNDLLDYILPAGISCNIYKENLVEKSAGLELTFKSNIDFRQHKSQHTSFIPKYSEVMGEDKPTDMLEISGLGGGRDDNSVIPPYEEE